MDAPKQFWDRLHGDRDRVWSGRVNAPLAENGWTVTDVDISTTALDRARAEATARGLHVDGQPGELLDGACAP